MTSLVLTDELFKAYHMAILDLAAVIGQRRRLNEVDAYYRYLSARLRSLRT